MLEASHKRIWYTKRPQSRPRPHLGLSNEGVPAPRRVPAQQPGRHAAAAVCARRLVQAALPNATQRLRLRLARGCLGRHLAAAGGACIRQERSERVWVL